MRNKPNFPSNHIADFYNTEHVAKHLFSVMKVALDLSHGWLFNVLVMPVFKFLKKYRQR